MAHAFHTLCTVERVLQILRIVRAMCLVDCDESSSYVVINNNIKLSRWCLSQHNAED